MTLPNKDQLKASLRKYGDIIRKRLKVLYFLMLAGLAGFLLFSINSYSQQEPTDEDVTAKLQTIKRPTIDANALGKIQQLRDQNVEVRSLFDKARDNPFSEGE